MDDNDDEDVLHMVAAAFGGVLASANALFNAMKQTMTQTPLAINKIKAKQRRELRSYVRRMRRNGIRICYDIKATLDVMKILLEGPGRGLTASREKKSILPWKWPIICW